MALFEYSRLILNSEQNLNLTKLLLRKITFCIEIIYLELKHFESKLSNLFNLVKLLYRKKSQE